MGAVPDHSWQLWMHLGLLFDDCLSTTSGDCLVLWDWMAEHLACENEIVGGPDRVLGLI